MIIKHKTKLYIYNYSSEYFRKKMQESRSKKLLQKISEKRLNKI